jgi:hypothetical protein
LELLFKEFEVLQSNLDLTNVILYNQDIIDALEGENPNNNEILKELIDTMKGMGK